MKTIPLTKGKVAIVDDDDYELVSQFKWHVSYTRPTMFYVRRFAQGRGIKLHRFILDAPSDKQVDHINGDTLDNRRCNLRLCTQSENMRNTRRRPGTSRFRGVSWCKANCKWRSQIRFNGRKIGLGYFATEEEAYAAYCAASSLYHGEFGRID